MDRPIGLQADRQVECSVPGALTGGGHGFFHPLRKVAALIMRAFPFSREPSRGRGILINGAYESYPHHRQQNILTLVF